MQWQRKGHFITEIDLHFTNIGLSLFNFQKYFKFLFLNSYQPLISRALKEIQKYATSCLVGKSDMFFINILSIRHQNKSYDYEDNDKYRQKTTKIQTNFPEESVEAN